MGDSERGFSIIEVLAAIGIISLIGLMIMNSSVMSVKAYGKSRKALIARQIATEVLESFSRFDPQSIMSDGTVTSTVQEDGISFTQEISVTINSVHRTRDVVVTVSTDTEPKVSVSLNNSYYLWGQR